MCDGRVMHNIKVETECQLHQTLCAGAFAPSATKQNNINEVL